MAKKNSRNMVLALLLVIGLTTVVWVLQDNAGLFSVTGGGNSMEQSPQDFTTDGCSKVDATSIDSAPEELGAEEYFALTKDHSLVEIEGVVYSCR